MKLFAAITSAILLTAGVAMAYDMTHLLNRVEPHQTRLATVDLPAGKSTVEVWGERQDSISCTFVDYGTNKVVYEASNVTRCIGTADLSLPARVQARITNNGNQVTDIRIQVHDTH